MKTETKAIKVRRTQAHRLTKAGWDRPAIAAQLGCTVNQVQHDRVTTKCRTQAPKAGKAGADKRAERRAFVLLKAHDSKWTSTKLAAKFHVSPETIRHDRWLAGKTWNAARLGHFRSELSGMLQAGRMPREIAADMKRARSTVERHVRYVLGGQKRKEYLAELVGQKMPVGWGAETERRKADRQKRKTGRLKAA
jgi:hypothetical protein